MRKKNGQPEPPPELVCPEELPPAARAEWDRITAELIECGVLSAVDRATLSIFCVAWSTWCEAVQHVQQEGALTKTPSGYLIMNPWCSVLTRQADAMLKAGDRLGFSPAARDKIFDAATRRKMTHTANELDDLLALA